MISIIVAMSKNRVIGHDGKLPWHLPSDLHHFKQLTMGHKVIMGRKTYESLPSKFRPLPGRENIVLSRREKLLDGKIRTFASLEYALDYSRDDSEVFVIGGQSVFEQTLPYVTRLYLTTVMIECEGDAYFPILKNWKLLEKKPVFKEEGDEYSLCFAIFVR